ncbi:hypothetical protein Pmar_PMAR022663 [Perkinsus marinus ATCC 50983]|uniref:Uncharacterized protein n=1 Tax=Perkinsus marinus (strain ATCC 50983 / TXsc) TaxID=423536 RepID=C5KGU2_PERM5|nr:hypothetical protein Pmar_PMAR022663 [Perkinsus marinus ATCC 50983]EER16301.1 hypothetical protein Pmar_PMAR022663 [Perkinsus marinus ATCC 50983]|eukprot:XP_002784505.1 hypothetical protein Pmar_PMAR022663 [Perkinsus marinus ATCC 50983]
MAYDTLSDPRKKVKFDQAYFYARHSAPRNFKRIPRVSPPSEDITLDGDLEGMSITKLKCIAKARGVDIATCIEKIDIITALKKGLEAPAATEVKNDKAPGATEQPKSPTKTASRVAPKLPENNDIGSRQAAYEQQIASHVAEVALSNGSLAASTALVERRYQELIKKLSESTEEGVDEEHKGSTGEKEARKMNVNRLAGFKDTYGGAPSFSSGIPCSGKSWSDLLPPRAARRVAQSQPEGNPEKGKPDSHGEGQRTGSETVAHPKTPDKVVEGSVKHTEVSQCGDESVKLEKTCEDSSRPARRSVTVKIPEMWRKGRRVQFDTNFGVVRFTPPDNSSPGDLMTFDPSTRMVRKRQPLAARKPSEGDPKVIWENGKEFVLLD